MNDADFCTKDRIASCDVQAKLAYDSWNDRRQYEWKFTIALWTVLVLGVGFFTKEVKLGRIFSVGLATAAFSIYFLWLRGIWRANEFDRQTQFHYQKQSRAVLENPSYSIKNFSFSTSSDPEFRKTYLSWEKFLFHYSHLTYLLTTILLLFFAFRFASGQVTPMSNECLEAIERATKGTTQSMETMTRQLEELKKQITSLQRVDTHPVPGAQRKRD